MYGNIGGGNRLDFTCIGPAVNLAARIEKVAARLARSIVASAEFAALCPRAFTPLGEFDVAGFSASQAVFGLTDSPQ
jgi:adenylate cyclase